MNVLECYEKQGQARVFFCLSVTLAHILHSVFYKTQKLFNSEPKIQGRFICRASAEDISDV